MFTIAYDTLRNPKFQKAITKIHEHTGFTSTKHSYHCMRITNLLDRELKTANELFLKVVKEHAETDAEGNLVPPKEGGGDYQVAPERQGAFAAGVKDFHSHTIEIDKRRIGATWLEGVALSPSDLDILSEVLDFGDIKDNRDCGDSVSE